MIADEPYDEQWDCVVVGIEPTGLPERPWCLTVETPFGEFGAHMPVIEHTWRTGDVMCWRVQYVPTFTANSYHLRVSIFRVNGRGPWIPNTRCPICEPEAIV